MFGQERSTLVVMFQPGLFPVQQTTQNIVCQRSLTLALSTLSLRKRLYKPTSVGHA